MGPVCNILLLHQFVILSQGSQRKFATYVGEVKIKKICYFAGVRSLLQNEPVQQTERGCFKCVTETCIDKVRMRFSLLGLLYYMISYGYWIHVFYGPVMQVLIPGI